MDIGRRYCQNRQRKRKRKVIPPEIEESKNESSSEDERKFKLKRFVEDVGHFLKEKENISNQEVLQKTKTVYSPRPQKTVKKVNIPQIMTNKCLYHRRGMQTKICKRGGVMTREKTAKLDEDLYKIISLTKNTESIGQCHCTQKSGLHSPVHGMQLRSSTSILKPSQLRSSPVGDGRRILSPQSDHVKNTQHEQVTLATVASAAKCDKSLSELDQELYPLFARVVSISCTQTKSALFKNQCYVSAVKRKLLDIYINGVKNSEDSLEHYYLKGTEKVASSVETSPFPSPANTQNSRPRTECSFKLAPAKVHFKSNMRFLEETIGPSSTSSSRLVAESPHCLQPLPQPCSQPPQSLLSPPLLGPLTAPRVTLVPEASSYMMAPSPTNILFDLKPKIYDGSGDGLHVNSYNSFLPMLKYEEENSPDFRYFPRRIF